MGKQFLVLFFILFLCLNVFSQVNLSQGLVAYYPFNGNANDVSGNNINGTVNAATLTTDAFGIANGAYEFDGNTSFISLPYSNLYNFAPTDSFSISTWILPYQNTSWVAQSLVVKSPFNANYFASLWNYGLYLVNNKAMTGWAGNNIVNGTTTMTNSQCWYNVIVTYKNGIWRLYVNGILEAQDLTQTHFIIQDGAASTIAFGRKGESSGDYYKGKMDEVRIYNRNLNVSEINALFNANHSLPDFSFTQNICNPKQLTFKNETQNTNTFLWNFGNNTTNNTNQNPVVNYAAYNNYNVKLIVTQTNGCIDSIEKNIPVTTQLVDGLIKQVDTSICSGTSIKLNVSDSGLAYCWRSSNGTVFGTGANQTVSPTANTTYYYNTQVMGNNLIVNGDFENGNIGFASDYIYQPPPRTSQSQYYIGNNPNVWFNPFTACKDHTSNSGNMMMFDGSSVANTAMWKQTIAIQPNKDYLFSGWVQSIVSQNPAQLILQINGNKVGATTTANLAACSWKQFSATWNSGNNTSADLLILDSNLIVQGNDFAIDDILFAPIIIKTDSVNIMVNNCTSNPICKGVVELHGHDNIIPSQTNYKKYFPATGFTWETWINGSYYDNVTATLSSGRKLMSALDIPNCQDIVLGFGWLGVVPKNTLCFVADGPNGCADRDNTPCTYFPTGGFLANTWYHVAGVRDYANNTSKLYINGVLVDSKTNNHGALNPGSNFIFPNFQLGSWAGIGATDSGFAGKMDEVRVWNYPRTASDIQSSYNVCSSGNEAGLVAYYHCNEKTGTVLHDATMNGNNAKLSSSIVLNKNDNAPIISPCLLQSFSTKDTTICQGQTFWGHNATNTYIDTFTSVLGCDSLRKLNLTVVSCNAVVASFTAPDTVCVNAPININNTSTGATTYNWNFCTADLNATPNAVNLGNIGGDFATPVFMDYVLDNGNYYGFVVNHNPGGIVRLDFGNSLLNTPTSVALGNIGGVMNVVGGSLGVQIMKQNGKYFMYVVGGTPTNGTLPKLLRFEFGTNITNTMPTATDFGNIGNMKQSIDLFTFQDNNNWYGFTVNGENNTLTRFDFTNNLTNPPTAVNLGNIGNLFSYPTGICAVNDNGFWRVFVTNAQGNFDLIRLDFGISLLNTPTAVNLGNPNGVLAQGRDIIINQDCNNIVSYVVNGTGNTIARLNFTSLSSIPTGFSLGNIGNFSLPHSLCKLFRVGSDVYTFITNAYNNTLTRLQFQGCTNSSIPNSTTAMPPAVSYNAAGTYNINLTIDEGLPTQSSFCKKVVVVATPNLVVTQNKTVCYDSTIQLNASGALSYNWSPKTWLNDSTISNPVSKPHSFIKYYVTAKNSIGCAAKDSVTITVLPKVVTTLDTIPPSCGSVTYNGNNYTSNILLSNNIKNYLGCDSIIQQHQIIVSQNKGDTLKVSICNGQSYLGNTTSGIYKVDSVRLSSGCDSISMVNLIVDTYIKDAINILICSGKNYIGYTTTGVYKDTIHSISSCDTIRTINLQVKNLPNPKLPNDTSVCEKDSLLISPGNFYSYLWNNGSNAKQIAVKNIGQYWVNVTDSLGCKASDSFKIISLYPLPHNFLPKTPQTVCSGEPFTLAGFNFYNWMTGETTATIALHTYTNYWVQVTDNNSCVGSDTMKVIYLGSDNFSFVNAFSPNNDGINDFFKPLEAACVSEFEMTIFNRWGQQVYQTHNVYGNGWDGKFNESLAPVGVYYYFINYKNTFGEAKKQSGSVALLR